MTPMEWLSVAAGVAIVTGTIVSVVKTLVVPRRSWSVVSSLVERATTLVFMTAAGRMRKYDTIDRFLGFLGPCVLILQLLVWLGLLVVGYALLLVPTTDTFSEALALSGSSTFTLGITARAPGETSAVDVAAAASGLIVIALTIAYLPAIYQVIRKRAVLSKQLANRIGSPAWGPHVLLEHTKRGGNDMLPGLYADWDKWACEVADGHTKYPILNQFRLPRSRHHWLLSLVAMMDAAALDMSSRQAAPPEAHMFLQSATACVTNDLATPLRIPRDSTMEPGVSKDEFADAVAMLKAIGFPCDIEVDQAWDTFGQLRAEYASTACQILDAIVAPPARWTCDRTLPTPDG